MTGVVVPLMEQRQLDFSYLERSATEVLTLHSALPVASYKSGLLMVRVHENGIGDDAAFVVGLFPTLPCATDGRQFASVALAVAELKVTADDEAPAYRHSPIPTVNAAHVLVQIKATQGAASRGFSAQLSAELLLRED